MTLPAPGRRTTRTPARGRAVAWQVLAVLIAAPLAVLSVFRAVPVEWPTPVVQLLAFTPWLVLPAVVAVLSALLSRRRRLLAGTAALLAVQLFWLLPLDSGRGAPAGGAPGVELTVMTINSEFGKADAAEIVRLVRDNGVGLLAVQEHTQALEDRLEAEGLASLLPHRSSHPTNGAAGSALYSIHPLRLVDTVPDSPFQMPRVRLTLDAAGQPAALDVTNVHAQPPVDGRVGQWRNDLAAIGRLTAGPGNLLLMGDFNATYDHSEFRRLLDGGAGGGAGGGKLVDVGTAEGFRLVPTWPKDGQALPGIVIDHLVTSPQIRSTAYSVHAVAGTDHAAVLATLAVPVSSVPAGSVPAGSVPAG
jgi:endonuclease/exonuclease/phosphatase (EEP) superfamily protein YafD